MSTINFEVKKVKPINRISDKQLDAFKLKDKKNDRYKKEKKKMVIPLLNKRTTIRIKRTDDDNDYRKRGGDDDDSRKGGGDDDDTRKRGGNRGGTYNLKRLKDDVEIGDNVADGDYEDVPIEDFGLAIFRGMGWKDGTEGVTAPVVVPRSKGLGLGADKMVGGGSDVELKVGGCCEVIAGKIKGRVGVVEGWDEVRVVVRIDGEVEALNPNFVVDISPEEFEVKRNKQQGINAGQGKNADGQKGAETSINYDKDKASNGKKNGSMEESDDDDAHELPWLHADLVVRVISKCYRGGKFYKQKVSIVDVTSPHTCMCRSTNQELLEGLKQSMLETVIPKENNCPLLILTLPHKFKRARLVERRKSSHLAVVRLEAGDDDDDQIVQVHYDDICLYKSPFY